MEAWRIATTTTPARAVAPYRSRPTAVAGSEVPVGPVVGAAEARLATALVAGAETEGSQATRALAIDQGLGDLKTRESRSKSGSDIRARNK